METGVDAAFALALAPVLGASLQPVSSTLAAMSVAGSNLKKNFEVMAIWN
jgi:hypothetical protein